MQHPPLPGDPAIWFLGGPPVGSGVFAAVRERLGRGEEVPLLDPASPAHGWRERAEALAARVRAAEGPVVLVAHGLAVPVALAGREAFAGLCLLNGPITEVDPVTHTLATVARRAPGLLAGALLRPTPWTAWLASSAGLRRAVVNPYAMDHDTVVALAASTVSTPASRRAVEAYLGSLAQGLPEVGEWGRPTLLAWADEDRLFGSYQADFVASRWTSARHVRVPGGRFLSVVERPWFVADLVGDFLADSFRREPIATSVSLSAERDAQGANRRREK